MARRSRRARAAVAGLLLLSLSSCTYEILLGAAFVNGRLAFILAPGQQHGSPRCLGGFAVSSERGETVWEIARPEGKGVYCGSWLPLLYAEGPPGFESRIPAQRLRMEVAYVVEADYGAAEGAFVLHRAGTRISVENLDWHGSRADDARFAIRNWRQEQARRAGAKIRGPQNEIVEGPFQDLPLPAEQH
jgi:hypothetical protein